MQTAAIVIGFNEGDILKRSLEVSKALFDFVLYVDSSSSDGSIKIAKSCGIQVLKVDLVSAAYARDMGIKHLSTMDVPFEVVFFMDADVIIAPAFVADVIQAFESRRRGVVYYGVKVDINKQGKKYKTARKLLINPDFLGGNFAINMTDYFDAGGFDHTLRTEEERDLLLRLYRNNVAVVQLPQHMGYHFNIKTSKRSKRIRSSSVNYWKLYYKSLATPLAHWRVFKTNDLIISGIVGSIFINKFFIILLVYAIYIMLIQRQLGKLKSFIW